jgi:uncharacterized repeat protein (TIGR03803 family)
VDPAGKETVLHAFEGYLVGDGILPVGGVTLDSAGNLYGATYEGGSTACYVYGCGLIYKVDPAGNYTILYKFTGGANGSFPSSGVILDAAGNLYGTTSTLVYKLDRTGHETVLYTFTGGLDGGSPSGNLAIDDQGNLYGTTTSGERGYGPVLYKLDPAGKETVLHYFGDLGPAGVVRDAAGSLYGTTAYGSGIAYRVDPSGQFTTLYTFSNPAGGFEPNSVTVGPTGNLFGSTWNGGGWAGGTVFEIKLGTPDK